MKEDRETEQQQSDEGAGAGIAADLRARDRPGSRSLRRADESPKRSRMPDGPRRSDDSPDPSGRRSVAAAAALDGAICNLQLVEVRSPGEFLDCCSVEVARREIHLREIATRGEHRVDQDTLSKMTDQSTSEMWRMLVMMLRTVTLAEYLLCCSSWMALSAVRPSAARRWSNRPSMAVRAGLLIPQPMDQLKRQRIGRRRRAKLIDQFVFRAFGAQ